MNCEQPQRARVGTSVLSSSNMRIQSVAFCEYGGMSKIGCYCDGIRTFNANNTAGKASINVES